MNENKVKVWIARDWNGALCVHCTEPFKNCRDWISYNHGNLENHYFPSVKWEDDEPTEAYITLANDPQEQPKHEIDWEQRRYEIVKEISAAIYSRPTVKTAFLNVYQIISAADTIIKELKKQSE